MRKIIHHLRQKPEHHRKKIAIALSACITGVIFMVWLSFFRLPYVENGDTNVPLTTVEGPVLILKESVASVYNSIGNDFFSFKQRYFGGGESD